MPRLPNIIFVHENYFTPTVSSLVTALVPLFVQLGYKQAYFPLPDTGITQAIISTKACIEKIKLAIKVTEDIEKEILATREREHVVDTVMSSLFQRSKACEGKDEFATIAKLYMQLIEAEIKARDKQDAMQQILAIVASYKQSLVNQLVQPFALLNLLESIASFPVKYNGIENTQSLSAIMNIPTLTSWADLGKHATKMNEAKANEIDAQHAVFIKAHAEKNNPFFGFTALSHLQSLEEKLIACNPSTTLNSNILIIYVHTTPLLDSTEKESYLSKQLRDGKMTMPLDLLIIESGYLPEGDIVARIRSAIEAKMLFQANLVEDENDSVVTAITNTLSTNVMSLFNKVGSLVTSVKELSPPSDHRYKSIS